MFTKCPSTFCPFINGSSVTERGIHIESDVLPERRIVVKKLGRLPRNAPQIGKPQKMPQNSALETWATPNVLIKKFKEHGLTKKILRTLVSVGSLTHGRPIISN